MSGMRQIILDATARIFADRCDRAVLERADAGEWPETLWQEVSAAGITRALLPEAQGGAGLSLGDALALIRLAGYYSVPLPLGETMIAARLLADAGLAVPDAPLSLAPCAPGGELRATRSREGWTLEGVCARVPWGARAHGVVAPVRGEGCAPLVLLDPRAAEVDAGANLAFEPRDTLRVQSASVPPERFVSVRVDALELYALGALVRAQQLAGAAERALELAVQYAGERVQFGRPIAKFQAIQQQLAVMAGHVAAAGAGADAAAAAWGTDKAVFAAAVAKARAGEAAGQAAAIAHQVHGAMGFTREHSLHYSTRRLWSWRDEFGGEAFWQRWLGRQALQLGGDGLWPFLVRPAEPGAEAWPQ